MTTTRITTFTGAAIGKYDSTRYNTNPTMMSTTRRVNMDMETPPQHHNTQEVCRSCAGYAAVETAVLTNSGTWKHETLCDDCYESYNAAVANHWKKRPWAYGQVRLG